MILRDAVPRRAHPLPGGLADIGHQGRQDEPGQCLLWLQKGRKAGNHDQGHGKANRAFDKACKKRDRHRSPKGFRPQTKYPQIHRKPHFSAKP
jgi:hypothetical protein